ncbi:hypothetical protein GLYMA_13G268701v4 [Glycine max]|nr:hypothetical protein GLYMA_13G268701v4 [Glycine max]KAH1103592.1 hypothetical protein GYH30_037500 [Glycine max]
MIFLLVLCLEFMSRVFLEGKMWIFLEHEESLML